MKIVKNKEVITEVYPLINKIEEILQKLGQINKDSFEY